MKTNRPKEWTYIGILVHPAAPNSSGIRWITYLPINLRADTKEGMRELIREQVAKVGANKYARSLDN